MKSLIRLFSFFYKGALRTLYSDEFLRNIDRKLGEVLSSVDNSVGNSVTDVDGFIVYIKKQSPYFRCPVVENDSLDPVQRGFLEGLVDENILNMEIVDGDKRLMRRALYLMMYAFLSKKRSK
ncbi:MAG: hypothetical protein V1718_03585 [archaeon]